MLIADLDAVIGVDTHRDIHSAALIRPTGWMVVVRNRRHRADQSSWVLFGTGPPPVGAARGVVVWCTDCTPSWVWSGAGGAVSLPRPAARPVLGARARDGRSGRGATPDQVCVLAASIDGRIQMGLPASAVAFACMEISAVIFPVVLSHLAGFALRGVLGVPKQLGDGSSCLTPR
jgi:hypothetical protein